MIPRISIFPLMLLTSLSHAAPIALSTGIVVDTDKDLAFAVAPDGHTRQLQLRDGSSVWTSEEKAFPLALADGYLMSLAASEASGSAILLLLDPNTGRAADRISIDLPEAVSADFFAKPGQRFEASIVDTEEGVRFYWRYERQPLRGAAIIEIDAQGNEVINPITVESGAFDLVSEQNRHFAIPVRSEAAVPSGPTVALQGEERVPGLEGEQYRAADNQHIQTATAMPDQTFGRVYQWSFFDRAGNPLGRYQSAYARAPFVLNDHTVILREQPIAFANEGGRWTERGPRLLVVNLNSGQELWSFDVLDTQYRGPQPP